VVRIVQYAFELLCHSSAENCVGWLYFRKCRDDHTEGQKIW